MLIDKYAPLYQQVNTKYQKSEVIAKIVAEVRNESPEGGFVKKDFYSGRWFEIGDEKARDKVGKWFTWRLCGIYVEHATASRHRHQSQEMHSLTLIHCHVGHAIRKAAAELGEKERGAGPEESTSRKLSHSAEQKRKLGKKLQRFHGSDTGVTASPGGFVGQNPSLLNDSSLMSLRMAQGINRLAHLSVGLGDLRADRATASFLTSGVDPSLLAATSTFASSSNMATLPSLSLGGEVPTIGTMYAANAALSAPSGGALAGLDSSNTIDNNAFLQIIHRRRLLLNEAQRQQHVLDLFRNSNDVSLLNQNNLDVQERRAAALSGSGLGLSLSHQRVGLASYGSFLPPAGLSERMLLQQALQQQQRASNAGTMLSQPSDHQAIGDSANRGIEKKKRRSKKKQGNSE